MGLVRWILGFAAALVIAAFALANRQDVDVIWSPVNAPLHGPLYLVILLSLCAGFLMGALMVWLNGFYAGIRARRNIRRIRTLERKLEGDTAPLPAASEGSKSVIPFLGRARAH